MTAAPTPEESAEDIEVDETETPMTDSPTTPVPTDMPTIAPIAPVPPNDLCVNAEGPLPISVKSADGTSEIRTQGTTFGASIQDMDRCGSTITSPSVWYYGVYLLFKPVLCSSFGTQCIAVLNICSLSLPYFQLLVMGIL